MQITSTSQCGVPPTMDTFRRALVLVLKLSKCVAAPWWRSPSGDLLVKEFAAIFCLGFPGVARHPDRGLLPLPWRPRRHCCRPRLAQLGVALWRPSVCPPAHLGMALPPSPRRFDARRTPAAPPPSWRPRLRRRSPAASVTPPRALWTCCSRQRCADATSPARVRRHLPGTALSDVETAARVSDAMARLRREPLASTPG